MRVFVLIKIELKSPKIDIYLIFLANSFANYINFSIFVTDIQ